jgi:17beta-estradiol 17-dehydrogenase / very-long-chain 3-oxoacyl-CoA reductase
VTGSTDGIGKGFAYALAKRGFNIISISRSSEKLKVLSSDLTSKFGIQVKNIPKDFSECPKDPSSFFNDIYSQTEGLDISILVNNVGAAHTNPFLKHSLSIILTQLALNTFALTFMSRMYLKQLSSRKNQSLIINVSSIIAEIPKKGSIIYAATKSFDLVFSQVLSSESKINVLALQPGFVKTQLIKNVKNPYFCIDVEECVESALTASGVVSTTSGHWKHALFVSIIKIVKAFHKFT